MDLLSKIASTVRNVVSSVGIASNRSPWLIAGAILTFFLFV
jgi:hypothetical protein